MTWVKLGDVMLNEISQSLEELLCNSTYLKFLEE